MALFLEPLISGLSAGNEIVQVEGLDGLGHLQKLVLDQNRVKMLSESCFTSHTHLTELYINDNRLRSLPNLQLPQLQRLFLNNNKLQVAHTHAHLYSVKHYMSAIYRK